MTLPTKQGPLTLSGCGNVQIKTGKTKECPMKNHNEATARFPPVGRPQVPIPATPFCHVQQSLRYLPTGGVPCTQERIPQTISRQNREPVTNIVTRMILFMKHHNLSFQQEGLQ